MVTGKLVLITIWKSYMSFRLVPNSVTLNVLERRNSRLASWVMLNYAGAYCEYGEYCDTGDA